MLCILASIAVSVNMATEGFLLGPLQYEVGEIVHFKGSDHIIIAIINDLGFDTYQLMNLDTGHCTRGHIHELDKRRVHGEALILDADDDSTVGEWSGMADMTSQTGPTNPSPPSVQSERFARLSDEELNNIAGQCTEKSTDKQTAWGVKLLRGRPNLHFRV